MTTLEIDSGARSRSAAHVAAGRGWWIGSAILATLAAAPVLGLVYFALRGSGALWPHLLAHVLPQAALTTAGLLLGVGLVTAGIGIGAAWLVAMYRFPGRGFFEVALMLPLAVPGYVMAYAYLDVVHPVGPVQSFLRGIFKIEDPRGLPFPEIRSLGGAIFLLGLILYPYVYVPVRALFRMRSSTLLDASRLLGAGRFRTFRRVALPMARPAVAVGLSLALLETLNDIGASEFLGVRTLTVAIYTVWVTRSSIEGAAQIALVMLLVVFLLLHVERRGRERLSLSTPARGTPPPTAQTLRGAKAALAGLACALPVTLGFGVPASYLALSAWQRVTVSGLPPALFQNAVNSLTASGLAAVLTVCAGLFLAQAGRMVRRRGLSTLIGIAGIGYAIPGTVLAVGLLVPIATLDNLLADLVRAATGRPAGLLFIGSGAALLLAYCLRFQAIAIGGIESGHARISRSLDLAARSLGAGPRRLAFDIHLPMLSPAIAAAALLIFVDAMKELPATLLLRPLNFETLATHVYGEAARGTYEDGAVSALAIVLVGLLPVIWLARTGERRTPPRAS